MSERGDDPRWNLFIAYDNQQPPTGPDVACEVASAFGINRIDFDVFGICHRAEDIVGECSQLGVLEQHLLPPNAGE